MGALVVTLLQLMGRIPVRWAHTVGRLMGWMLAVRRTRSREVARLNLQMTYPKMASDEREQLLQETLRHTGMAGTEMGVFWGASPDKGRALIREVHGLEVMQQALADERGLLLCVPHLGNWEVLNHYVTTLTPITAMYRPAKDKTLDNWMLKSREETGIKMVPTTAAGIKRLFKELKAGKPVGILPDQEPRRPSGEFAPFMGVPTLTPRLPHELIQRCNAVVVFGFSKRLPNSEGFDIYFLPAHDKVYSTDSVEACEGINLSVEACVRLCPEQYQWTYKRFKRQPEGVPNPYKAAGLP